MADNAAPPRPRLTGVDVARGVALFGMMATHVFSTFTDEHTPGASTVIASGRSAATFALIAGVSLAFMSAGRDVVPGRGRTAVAAALVVRAGMIGAIGLLLGFTESPLDVILPFYALMFLLAIPLLPLPPKALAVIAGSLMLLAPVLLTALAAAGLQYATRPDPTPVTLVTDPVGLLGQLLVTGYYPVVVYMAYLCAGLAIGRLDLRSSRLAWWLLGGGMALAVVARVVSHVLLHPLGGLAALVAHHESDDPAWAATDLLWEPEQGSSWWYLALASPHAHTPPDLAHSLGAGMAVLGASLLLTRITVVRRLLGPLTSAGAMTLTLYSAHLLVLETGVLGEHLTTQYLLLVFASLIFAVLWRRWQRQGPLEGLVAAAAGRARRAVSQRDGRATTMSR
jgi:uncharacterized membrane protein YeiB